MTCICSVRANDDHSSSTVGLSADSRAQASASASCKSPARVYTAMAS